MVQISPKYFHSQEEEDHVAFNSSRIFKKHPFTSLLKLLLTLELLWPLLNSFPNHITSKRKIQIFCSETIVSLDNGDGGAIVALPNWRLRFVQVKKLSTWSCPVFHLNANWPLFCPCKTGLEGSKVFSLSPLKIWIVLPLLFLITFEAMWCRPQDFSNKYLSNEIPSHAILTPTVH